MPVQQPKPLPLPEPTLAPTRQHAHAWLDLLRQTRLTAGLLALLGAATLLSVVIRQREPFSQYVQQFGPLGAAIVDKLDLNAISSAWWFLLILLLLLLSSSFFAGRSLWQLRAELREFHEHQPAQALQTLPHRSIGQIDLPPEAALQQLRTLLNAQGWTAKAQRRERGVMVAARKGAAARLGTLTLHAAVLLISVGGLLNSDLLLRAQMRWQGKSVYDGGGLIRDIDASHRLSLSRASFHSSLLVPEGGRAATAVLNLPDGVLLQDLPFDVSLKQLSVKLDEAGRPQDFASTLTLQEHEGGAARTATVKRHEPIRYRGISIEQSGVDDGGSRLSLRQLPLQGEDKPRALDGVVGARIEVGSATRPQKIELTGLQLHSVEMLSDALGGSASNSTSNTASASAQKTPHPLGVSFSYLLRDAEGQAHEFKNFMAPVSLGGHRVFLMGVREQPGEDFNYLRIPADAKDSKDAWLRLRADLARPELCEWAARRYAAQATPKEQPGMMPELYVAAKRALSLFSGADAAKAQGADKPRMAPGGLAALSQFVDKEVPAAERRNAAEALLRILNGSVFELYKLGLEQRHLPAPEASAALQDFMPQAVLALSDSMLYPADFLLELQDFKQVQAGVFQLTRTPGQPLMALGLALLLIGVLLMRYLQLRRLWIWLEPAPGQPGCTRARMAMACAQPSKRADAEFDGIRQAFLRDMV